MDEVAQTVAKVKKEWDQSVVQIQDRIRLIESCGTSGKGTEEANSLPRLNGAAQDGLAVLRSLQFKLDFLAQQLSTEEEIQSAQLTLEFWKEQYQSLHKSLRNANLQAKNNIRKAAQQERELLLGGGEESTIRRRNLQYVIYLVTLITSKNKGWNDISCRKHYREPPPYAPNYGSGSRKKCKYFGNICTILDFLIVLVNTSMKTVCNFSCCVFRKIFFDCCECGPNSPTSGMYHAEESTGVLRRAESEYKGHRPLLMRTRNLLSTMRRQDVLDRVILVVGFLIFTSAVLYVVWKRIGLLALQRKIMAVVKAGSRGQGVVQELEIGTVHRVQRGSVFWVCSAAKGLASSFLADIDADRRSLLSSPSFPPACTVAPPTRREAAAEHSWCLGSPLSPSKEEAVRALALLHQQEQGRPPHAHQLFLRQPPRALQLFLRQPHALQLFLRQPPRTQQLLRRQLPRAVAITYR
ncbi:hypothetical protein ZIOFF_041164 [Zingiber officinale]|uniref:Sec20 C-terminal domain-containing protein n=1 Tax=Zingiber officinale TaxID=94328 RepID=A0A8J5G670_ZINOF|nr:hypothetical protein ZIOFF_041164 [Zingiber officinale]